MYDHEWKQEQDRLKDLLIKDDVFDKPLHFIGGVDISFIKGDNTNACASLCILSLPDLQVVYRRCEMVQLTSPYVCGYLAFREVPILRPLIEQLRRERPELIPQILLVDGNGTLHPRDFGVACHLGVVCDIPTIGVAKTLLSCDGIPSEKEVRRLILSQMPLTRGSSIDLVDENGRVRGRAVLPTATCRRPIYVSAGHCVSLASAVDIVLQCCRTKIPEPIRQADLGSREALRLAGFNLKEADD